MIASCVHESDLCAFCREEFRCPQIPGATPGRRPHGERGAAGQWADLSRVSVPSRFCLGQDFLNVGTLIPRVSGRSLCRAGGHPRSGHPEPASHVASVGPPAPLSWLQHAAPLRQGLVCILPGGPCRSLAFRCFGSLLKTYMRHKVYYNCFSRESSPCPTPCCGFSSSSKRT